ncbi:hypothetical protein LINPERHAP1_LOCUS7027 [Linum perenne]
MAAAAAVDLRNFNPSEKDLVDYLWLKLHGEIIPIPSNLVPEIDIYGNQKPWEMFDNNNGNRFYAFARLKKRGGRRFHRRAGGGTWELNVSENVKTDERFKKRFFVYRKEDELIDGMWSMREFSLVGAVDNDFVICKVEFKFQKPKRRESRDSLSNLVDLLPESGTEATAAADAVESLESGEEIKIRAEEDELGEFDLESTEEIIALTENFWSEPPGNIWKTMSWNDDVLMF